MTSVELRRWVMIAGIALIALIIGADSYEAWADYRRVMADNQHLELALSRAVTEQTARMIQAVDVLLSGAMGNDGGRRLLLGQLRRLPFVQSALVTDGDGRVLAATQIEAPEKTLRDLDVFAVPRAGSTALYIDHPVADSDGTRTFAVSRRIESEDGSFAGVVIARIAFDYLAAFYARINVTPDTLIRLMRNDGVMLAEYPNGAPQSRASSSADRSIETAEQVSGYPIEVVVSRSSHDVLQPWIQEEESSAARTLSLSVLAGILLMALHSALNRQERMDRERLRLEQELAAVQRIDALGFLAASVAHDFNNVLTAIIGYAELASETLEAGSTAQQNLERLLAATERARLLVRRVLTFDPHRSVRYRPTNIGPIVTEVAEQIRATLPSTVKMSLHGMDRSVCTSGDPTEMYQVLMNLCSNAVHAMPAGGSLEMRLDTLEIRESRDLAMGQLQPGRWAALSVVDTGIGLADAQTLSIFEPFYTTRSNAHGTGIGLTVVRNIILRMQGALDVSSQLDQGTRMTVYWPITEAPVPAPRLTGKAEPGAGETIMVVDDQRELVALTEELLASLSYEPVGFFDARAALDAFTQDPQRFDAILTDERMQPMGGLEFAHSVHRIEPYLPIILMTGHRDAQIDSRAAAEGILEILDKPVRVQTLREALSRALKRAKQEQA